MKKSIFLILSLLLIFASLMSCSEQYSNSSSTTVSAEEGRLKSVKLTLWDINPAETDPKYKPRQEALEYMKTQMPNVTVETSYFQDLNYRTTLQVRAAANELPDIFFNWGGGLVEPLAKSGNLLDLTPYEKELSRIIVPSSMETCYFDGKLYAVPSIVQAGLMYYNKKVFDEFHLPIPNTWSQLIADVKIFRAGGIIPMAIGEKDLWPGCYVQTILAVRTAGVQTCQRVLTGKMSFETPEIIESGQKVLELVNAGAFGRDILATDWNEAYQQFLQGETAMTFNGNWISGMLENDKVPFEVEVRNFPAIEGSKVDQDVFVGGSSDFYMIGAKTAQKETTVKYLEGFMQEYVKRQVQENGAISCWNLSNRDTSRVGPIVKQQNTIISKSAVFSPVWDTSIKVESVDTYHNLVSQLFVKKLTEAEWARKCQQLINRVD